MYQANIRKSYNVQNNVGVNNGTQTEKMITYWVGNDTTRKNICAICGTRFTVKNHLLFTLKVKSDKYSPFVWYIVMLSRA